MLILGMQLTRDGAHNLFTVHTYNISVKFFDFGMRTCSGIHTAASETAFMDE